MLAFPETAQGAQWDPFKQLQRAGVPSQTAKSYSFTLDRRLGLLPNSGPFQLSVTHGESAKELEKEWKFGETVTLKVQPQEVIVLDFQR